ncbi:hypothetical protein PRIC1_008058 [Phytophthora ramorum]
MAASVRDTNKRARVASAGELETQHKKKTETPPPASSSALAYEMWSNKEEKSPFPATQRNRMWRTKEAATRPILRWSWQLLRPRTNSCR